MSLKNAQKKQWLIHIKRTVKHFAKGKIIHTQVHAQEAHEEPLQETAIQQPRSEEAVVQSLHAEET